MLKEVVVVRTQRQAWRLHLLFRSAWKEVTGRSPKERAPVFVEDTGKVVMIPGPACYTSCRRDSRDVCTVLSVQESFNGETE